MSYTHYDRLTALDATFLALEDTNVHMHVGSVGIFEAGPLTLRHGGIDFERIRAMSEATLSRHPRFRQKLAHVPLLGQPVWVDDEHFNLNYHLRHTSLPLPGDVRRLKRLTGRIMSQKLDRSRPLWEMWFVDGLEGGRFAVVTKVHHCMIDGISGVDLMSSLMRADSNRTVPASRPWLPRPVPSGSQLLADELWRRASLPVSLLRGAQHLLAEPRQSMSAVRKGLGGIGEAFSAGLAPATSTPLNPEIGPHRRFDWTRFDLEAVKSVKNRLGGTINDVVLACVAGAIRRFLQGRGVNVRELDFRSMVPVSIRSGAERGTLGNRVSFLLAHLPIDEKDPLQRMRRVIEETQKLKGSSQVLGAELIEEVSDRTFAGLFVRYARMAAKALSYNMVVTNVPGPQFPVYLLGAKMLESYPLVPLFNNQALGIALFSYDGSLFWGFNSDWDALPDLHDLVGGLETEFAALRRAAGEKIEPGRTKTGSRPRRRAAKRARVAHRAARHAHR